MNLFKAPSSAETQSLSDIEKLAWLRLIRTENIGPITFYNLLEVYGSAEKALEALPQLSKKGGRLKDIKIAGEANCLYEMEQLAKLGGKMIFAAEGDYPLSLSAVEDSPPVLSVIGNIRLTRLPAIGVVGARNASLNGRKFTEQLSRDLGSAGQIVVSGLARGIDTAAHIGSLPTGTIAAVAGGIDIVYPPENRKLYDQIKDEGLVVAESPLGIEPMARHFPKRNRIISGLSSGVVVIEASIKSGSLITARMAAEQGRDVFAVPGHPYDPRAAGPNKLIQDGAALVQNADDILNATSAFQSHSPHFHEPMPDEWQGPEMLTLDTEEIRSIILQNMSTTPLAVDELIRNCQLTIPSVQMALLELELAGRLQRLPGNRIVLLN